MICTVNFDKKSKMISISFLIVLFLSQVGYHILYTIQQVKIKNQQKEYLLSILPESYFQRILDNDHIYWLEENEFFYKGSMFDVAKTIIQNGAKIYLVISDENETELLTRYNHLVEHSGHNQTDESVVNTAFKNILPLYFSSFQVSDVIEVIRVTTYFLSEEIILSRFTGNIFIPPRQ